MADEDKTAKTSLSFDASGAQKGAADFKAAGEQVIASEAAVQAAAAKTASAVEASETKKSTARRTGSKAAQDAAVLEAAAAAAGGNAIASSTDRVVTQISKQIALLDRYAKAWDPLVAAATRAQSQLAGILDVKAQGGAVGQRAASMQAEAVDRLNAAQRNASAGFDVAGETTRLTTMFDAPTASARRMTGELADLNRAQQLGVSIAGGYQNAWDAIVLKYDEGAQAAERVAAAQRDLVAQARATQNAQTSQTQFNQILGVPTGATTGAKSAADSASVFQEEFAKTDALLAERKKLEAQLNPIKTASLAYAQSLTDVDRAEQLQILSAQQAVVARENVTKAFAAANAPLAQNTALLKGHTVSTGQADFATRQMGVQTIQFFTSLQAGQPIITAFIQQFHQIVDVAVATGTTASMMGKQVLSIFQSIGSWMARNPIPIAIGLITAAMGALVIASESTERRLGGLRNILGGVRDDAAGAAQMVEAAARHLAATTSISTSEGRTASTSLLSARQFQGSQEQLEALVTEADKLSLRLGETLPESAERFKKGMADPAALVKELADRGLKGFNAELLVTVQRQQAAGDKAGAFNTVLAAVRTATDGVTKAHTPLQEALDRLGKSFTTVGANGRSLADSLGDAISGALGRMVDQITEFIEVLKTMWGWIDKVRHQAPPTYESWDMTGPMPSGGLGRVGPQGVLQSPTGALGVGQLLPSTARGLQVPNLPADQLKGLTAGSAINPLDATQNVLGMMLYIQQLSKQFSDTQQIAGAYNMGPEGYKKFPQGAKHYQQSVYTADTSKLPTDTAGMIAYWGEKLNMSPALINLGMRIAVPESGGNQFAGGTGLSPAAAAAAAGAPAVGTQPAGASPKPSPSGVANTDLVQDALKKADTMGLVPAARSAAVDDIRQFQEALAKLRDEGKQDSPEFERLNSALRKSQLALQDAIEPTTKLTEEITRQTSGQDRITTAYGKNYAEVVRVTAAVKAEEEARKLVSTGTAEYAQIVADLTAKYVAQANAEQNTKLTEITQDITLQVSAQEKLIAAYGKGYDVVIRVTAATKAEEEARALAKAGLADYDSALATLTAGYTALANAQAKVEISQKIALNQSQVSMIQAQTSSLSMDNDQRVIYLAHLQAEQELKLKGLPINDEFGQSYIKSAEDVAKANLTFDRQKKALDEVAGSFQQSFDTIGNAMTQAFVSGEGAAVNWKNVMSSVLQQVVQQILKLAVLNPMLNELFGGNRSTMGDVFQALGTRFGGAAGAGGDTATSTSGGIMGWLTSALGGAKSGADTATTTTATEHHRGGLVGANENQPLRSIPNGWLATMPRFHNGLGGNEFAAILEKGERVLTTRQQGQVAAAAGGGPPAITFNFPANTQPDQFRRAGAQVASHVSGALDRARTRHGV